MKTDRELLELAARAAGYKWSESVAKKREALGVIGLWLVRDDGELGSTNWNPLENDADALRLAVKLNMQIVITGKSDSLDVGITDARSTESGWEKAIHIKCPYDATRRAIVRAAAAIGETL
mgnify:CR=1 FL=1